MSARRPQLECLVGTLIAVILVMLVTSTARAAGPKLDAKWEKAAAGEITLTVTLERGWHLNANDPDKPYLIPTTLEIVAPTGTSVESIRYPEAVVQKLAFAPDTVLRLYQGTFAIRVKIDGSLPSRFDATLGYQACNDETCLPPATLAVPYEGSK